MRFFKTIGLVVLLVFSQQGSTQAADNVLKDCREAVLSDKAKQLGGIVVDEPAIGYDNKGNMYTIRIVRDMISFSDTPNYQCQMSTDGAGLRIVNVFAQGRGTL